MKRSEGLPVDLALLVIRLALGAVFIAHGLNKFMPAQFWGGNGIEGLTKFLEFLHVPQPQVMAYLVAGWELGGGALLVIGLASRIAALGLLANMIVALVKVHLHNGLFLYKPGALQIQPGEIGYEFVLVLGAMALAIVVAGAGQLSADSRVGGGKKKPA